uniref:ZnMc domain-containing protein n=1 Tax=Syphacia muris TaxID=451379 RepID=A0A158R5K1_9BILA
MDRWLFCCVILLLLTLSSYSKKVYKPVSDEEAKKYLLTFGYVPPSNVLSASPDSGINSNIKSAFGILKTAIKKFQEFAGLKPTGELDDKTKRKMAEPRCGVTDVLQMVKEPSTFIWPKHDLTYSIQSYPRLVSQDYVEYAFKKWSDVSPLNFKQLPKNGDIVIQFAYGQHGDPWPFDGKGGVLAHATFPTFGTLHFDEDENWPSSRTLIFRIIHSYMKTDLLSVAIHEIGHTLGLEHSYNQAAIMAPFYQDPTDDNGNYKEPSLRQDDIKRIQQLYGNFNQQFNVTGINFELVEVTRIRDRTYLLSSTKVYEIDEDRIVNVDSIRHVFPMSPAFTQGAFAANGFVYIFDELNVYKYMFDRSRGTYKLQIGYPKRLPYELRFGPMGAFNWLNNKQYLFNANEYAVYDASSNKVLNQGLIKNVFRNFPALEALRGICHVSSKSSHTLP